jgi:uncharacterized membrane protein YgdD (TMEM256/DUF423 family)
MVINKHTKTFLKLSAILMALAISIGAFGAHTLKPYLDEYGLSIYSKASSYEFYMTIGLFIISFISIIIPNSKKVKTSFYLVLSGMIIFSFSLYTLALTKIMWLGAITPIGGSLMIAGWIVLFFAIKNDIDIK